jgi:hypothetical protein
MVMIGVGAAPPITTGSPGLIATYLLVILSSEVCALIMFETG